MGQFGDRLRDVETREGADMIEVTGDPNTLNGGAGVVAAPGLLAINPATGFMYYNQDGDPTGWIGFGTSDPIPGGEINTGANVGTSGGEVYRDKTGVVLNFRKIAGVAPLVGATNVDLVNVSLDFDLVSTVGAANATDLVLLRQSDDVYTKILVSNLTTGGGEDNTGANVGTGSGVYQGMSGTVLQFRSLIGTLPIITTQNANDITFSFGINGLSAITPLDGTEEFVVEQTGVVGKTTFDALMTEAGGVIGAANLGPTGEGIYTSVSSQLIQLKKLHAQDGEPIIVYSDSDRIYFGFEIRLLADAPSSPPPATDYFLGEVALDGSAYRVPFSELGEDNLVTGATSLGTGVGEVYKQLNGTTLEFRSLTTAADHPIYLVQTADSIDIALSMQITAHPTPTSGDKLLIEPFGGPVYSIDWSVLVPVVSVSSIGTGGSVFSAISARDVELRSIIGGDGIGVTENANDLTVDIDFSTIIALALPDAADYLLIQETLGGATKKILYSNLITGLITGGTSLGLGADVYESEVSGVLRFRSFLTDGPITVTEAANDITIGIDVASLTTIISASDGDWLIIEDDTSGIPFKIDWVTLVPIVTLLNVGAGSQVFRDLTFRQGNLRSLIGTAPIDTTQNADDITFTLDILNLTAAPSPVAGDFLVIQDSLGPLYKIDYGDFLTGLGYVTGGISLGSGVAVYVGNTAGVLQFNSIIGSNPIVVTSSGSNEVDIDIDINTLTVHPSPGAGDYFLIRDSLGTNYKIDYDDVGAITGAANIGAGSNIYESVVAGVIQLRTLIGTPPVAIGTNANDLTLSLGIISLLDDPGPTTGHYLLIQTGAAYYKLDYADLPTGTITGALNVGTGAGAFKADVSNVLQFRSFSAILPITVAENTDEIEFNLDVGGLTSYPVSDSADLLLIETAVSGLVYKIDWGTIAPIIDITSIGTGAEVYRLIDSRTVWIRSLIGGSGISATQNTDDITLDLDVDSLTTHPSPAEVDWLVIEGNLSNVVYKIDWSTLVPVINVSNVGTGSNILSAISSRDAELRSILGTAPIIVTQNTSDLTFSFDILGLTTAPSPAAGDYMIVQDSLGANYKVDFGDFLTGTYVTDAANIGTGSGVYESLSGTVLQLRSILAADGIIASQNANDITLSIEIDSLTTHPTPDGADWLLFEDDVTDVVYKINWSTLVPVISVSNIGTGSNVFSAIVSRDAEFRSLVGSEGIVITESANELTFDFDVINLVTNPVPSVDDWFIMETNVVSTIFKIDWKTLVPIVSVSNVGAGSSILSSISSRDAQLRTLIGTPPVAIATNANDLTLSLGIISLVDDPGPALGHYFLIQTGAAYYKLDYADLPGGTITGAANLGTGANVFESEVSDVLRFRSFIATLPIALTQNANDITFDFDILSLTTHPSPAAGDYMIVQDSLGTQYKVDFGDFLTSETVTGATSLGAGSDVYKQLNGTTLEFRSLTAIAGAPVWLFESATEIQVALTMQITNHPTPGSGDKLLIEPFGGPIYSIDWSVLVPVINVSNIGAGSNILSSISSRDAELRSLIGTSPITTTQNTNDITFDIAIGPLTLKGSVATGDMILMRANLDGNNYKLNLSDLLTNLPYGETNLGDNLGAGAEVYIGKTFSTLNFRSFIATLPVTVTQNANDITFDFDILSLTTHPSPTTGDFMIVQDSLGTQYKVDFGDFLTGTYVTDAANLGTGAGIYESLSGTVLQLRSLSDGAGINVSLFATDITFDLDVKSLTTHPNPAADDWLIIESDIASVHYKASWLTLVPVVNVANVGTGISVISSLADRTAYMRAILGGEGITPVLSGGSNYDIVFDLDITGITTAGTPAGTDSIAYEDGVSVKKSTVANLMTNALVRSASNRTTTSGSGVFHQLTGGDLEFKKLYAPAGMPITIVPHTSDDYLEFDFDISSTATAPAIPAGTDILLVEKSSDGSHYKLPLSDFEGNNEQVVVDKIVWFSQYERITMSSPTDHWRDVTTGNVPSTATGVICRLAWTTEGASGWFAVGPDLNDYQVVLWQGNDKDAAGVVKMTGDDVRIESNGTGWAVVLDIFGYILPVTITGSAISPRGGRWQRNTDTAIATDSFYAVSWETEDRDSDGMWSSGTDITIKTAGTYVFTLELAFATTVAGKSLQALIYQNAAEQQAVRLPSGNFTTRIQANATIVCAVNDIIKGYGRHSYGSNLTLLAAKMSIDRISG